MAVGSPAHGLQPFQGVAAERRRRPSSSSGVSADDVTPSEATGAAVELQRALQEMGIAARLRAWRVSRVTCWRAERAGPKGGSEPTARTSSGLARAQREGRQARDPRAREGPRSSNSEQRNAARRAALKPRAGSRGRAGPSLLLVHLPGLDQPVLGSEPCGNSSIGTVQLRVQSMKAHVD